jgi:hypothetical protein
MKTDIQVSFNSQELQEMFFEWLEGTAIALPFLVIQPALAEMDNTVMPPDLGCRHGFLVGCSIAHAAHSVICLLGPDDQEYRLETLIHFADERASSEWWARNRDNLHRIVVKPNGNGEWSVSIAAAKK